MNIYIDFTCWNTKKKDYYGGGEYYTYCIIMELLKSKRNITLLWKKDTDACNELQNELLYNSNITVKYIEEISFCDFSNCDVFFEPNLRKKTDIIKLNRIRRNYPHLKIVLTIHDLRTAELSKWDSYGRFYYKYGVFEYILKLMQLKLKWILIRLIMLKKLNTAADKVLTVSNYSMQQIIKYSGINNISYYFQTAIIDESIKKDDFNGTPYFLFVSADREEKNFIRALEAYLIARNNRETEYNLYVTGYNENIKKYFEEAIKKYDDNIRESIIFLGYVPEKEMQRLYANCAALLFTSKCEGFGIPVLNASLYGKPVIASNRTSIPEVIGATGIYIDPYDVFSIRKAIRFISQKENYKIYELYTKENIPIIKFKMKMEMSNLIEDITNRIL